MKNVADRSEIIRVVQDLNAHTPTSFCERNQKRQDTCVRRLNSITLQKIWLNMAEIEFSALMSGSQDRRYGILERESLEDRNAKSVKVKWRFTIRDAREKLRGIILTKDCQCTRSISSNFSLK